MFYLLLCGSGSSNGERSEGYEAETDCVFSQHNRERSEQEASRERPRDRYHEQDE